MFPIRNFLYVCSVITLSFDFVCVVLGVQNGRSDSASIGNSIESEEMKINETYHYIPEGVGGAKPTEVEFTNKMKTLFSGNDEELLCNVTLSEKLTTIPNITCKGAFSEVLKDSLRKLKINYTDEDAQNKVLDLVWKSKVGVKMLALLSEEIFGNQSDAKASFKEMWFMHEGATFVRLFPDVFLGYESQEEFNGGTINTENNQVDEKKESPVENGDDAEEQEGEEEEEYDDEFEDFRFDAAPVSWTGNYFRQIEGDLEFKTGHTRPLVDNSLYLADIEVELGNGSRNSTFIVGTTFIYDFISFSMCWIYGVRLEKCIVPLPGNTTKMIEITNITSPSTRLRSDNYTEDVYFTCIGFKVNDHHSN